MTALFVERHSRQLNDLLRYVQLSESLSINNLVGRRCQLGLLMVSTATCEESHGTK